MTLLTALCPLYLAIWALYGASSAKYASPSSMMGSLISSETANRFTRKQASRDTCKRYRNLCALQCKLPILNQYALLRRRGILPPVREVDARVRARWADDRQITGFRSAYPLRSMPSAGSFQHLEMLPFSNAATERLITFL